MTPLRTITLDDIHRLIKKYLDVDTTRTTIYNWQRTKKFPKSLGFGRPRRWRRDIVMKWIANQIKKSEQQ